jgi:hypothetical protein
LLDEERCRAVTNLLDQLGTEWEVRQAVPDLHLQLPEASGLYMFVWRPSLRLKTAQEPHIRDFPWILYLGQAGGGSGNGNLRQRYHKEYSKVLNEDPNKLFLAEQPNKRLERLRRYLRVRPLEYWWVEVPDRQKLVKLEKILIGMLQPPLNDQHNHARLLKTGKPTNAFEER